MSANQYCILVPHYNHAGLLEQYLPALIDQAIPIVVVDDGSSVTELEKVRGFTETFAQVTLIECSRNEGKGAAMQLGFVRVAQMGFSHAVCVDADGQHDATDIGEFCELADEHPAALVSGRPVFGEDIPKSRLYGRMITNWLSRVESLSPQIEDAMCGFRIYPLALCAHVQRRFSVGKGMEFDTQMLVFARWLGYSILFSPTAVVYPETGVSHFRMWQDNARMTLMHIGLLCGAVVRIPGKLLPNSRQHTDSGE